MSLFWKIVDSLEPDSDQAQLVIGLPSGPEGIKRLEQLGPWLAGQLTGYTEEGEEAEAVLVVATASSSFGEVVDRLSEMGIKQLHAIHARKAGAKDAPENKVDSSKEGT